MRLANLFVKLRVLMQCLNGVFVFFTFITLTWENLDFRGDFDFPTSDFWGMGIWLIFERSLGSAGQFLFPQIEHLSPSELFSAIATGTCC